MKTTTLKFDGKDIQIIHDALLALRESRDHSHDEDVLLYLLIKFQDAAERVGVKVEV